MENRHIRGCPPLVLSTAPSRGYSLGQMEHCATFVEEASAVSKMSELCIRSNPSSPRPRSQSVFNTDSYTQEREYYNSADCSPLPILSHSLTVPDLFTYQKRSSSFHGLEHSSSGFVPLLPSSSPHRTGPTDSVTQIRRHSHHLNHSIDIEGSSTDRNACQSRSTLYDLGPYYTPNSSPLQRHPSPDLYQRHLSESDIRTEWICDKTPTAKHADYSPTVPEKGEQTYDNVFRRHPTNSSMESDRTSTQDFPLDLSIRSSFSSTSTADGYSMALPDRRNSTLSSSSSESGSKGFEYSSFQQYKSSVPNSSIKSHLCDVCKRTFARSDMLTRHMRLHTGFKPYSCATCGQVFSRSDHLSTHQRTHTGEKPYKCPSCPYSACRRDMITRHMRTHTRRAQGKFSAMSKWNS